MNKSHTLPENINQSPLYSPDLAPVEQQNRTWNRWNLAALWVGMAVCIPTYMLASYMIKSGLSWVAALVIIGLANLVITVPMVLNGDAGVRYGIPFPVIGRAAFGTKGVHVPSFLRALVACGWFGVQTWIGGLAIYSIYNAATGNPDAVGLSVGKFVAFGIFWLINIYFIWKGTESIKWLEDYSAPILILIGLLLIGWGYQNGGSFSNVLQQSQQLGKTSVVLSNNVIQLETLKNADGTPKATQFKLTAPLQSGQEQAFDWQAMPANNQIDLAALNVNTQNASAIKIQFKNAANQTSSVVTAAVPQTQSGSGMLWTYILWFTAMVGFWATMAISISDITRFAKSQTDQIQGQLMGLPGTMIFYSFVGIFVTCAAVLVFNDLLIVEDAPWDPVSLVSKFNTPAVVIFAQFAMIIATLSTNIAANVIAPAYAFSNLFPKQISFKMGGVIAGIVGILICPWWLMDSISGLLVLVSGLLGPILGILLCDYFVIRKKQLSLPDLYLPNGAYSYSNGINPAAMVAMVVGIVLALLGKFVPSLSFLFSLSWFTGFAVAFVVYWAMMKRK